MTNEQMLIELKEFATQFQKYDIYSYEEEGYLDGLDDWHISDENWNNSELLRKEFEQWLTDNNLNSNQDTEVVIDFTTPSIKIFGLVRTIE